MSVRPPSGARFRISTPERADKTAPYSTEHSNRRHQTNLWFRAVLLSVCAEESERVSERERDSPCPPAQLLRLASESHSSQLPLT